MDLICSNAPISIITNDECVSFSNTCILNYTGYGCVDKICENI